MSNNEEYVVGWFRVGGGSGTLPKIYTDKDIAINFAVELQKSTIDRHTQYFCKPYVTTEE